jgi:lipid-A-disaccharide synthase
VLEAADAVLVASGTATLEAALYKRPMVIAYRMPAFSAWLMRRKGRAQFVGLPNILTSEALVPELLQEQATAPAIAAAVRAQLADNPGRARLEQRFAELHEALRRDTVGLVAEAIAEEARR